MNREEAWKELKATIVGMCDNNDETSTQQKVCKFLANLMSIIEMQITDDWIPVSERLPENGEDVLVCFPEGGMAVAYCDTYYSTQYAELNEVGWFNAEGDAFDFDPIAWMPLPKSYEPQEKER